MRNPDAEVQALAERLINGGLTQLPPRERRVIGRIAQRLHVARNIERELRETASFGDRMADRIAAFGGSWTFILVFLGVLAAWVVLNSFVLLRWGDAFDPYPYIFLNLVLSMLAALQAPVIMMAQNRQAARDRAQAQNDYEVNLKAELEIMALHDKLDAFRSEQLRELLETQRRQLDLLERLARGQPAQP
jgi:uncharacterized membrane protein